MGNTGFGEALVHYAESRSLLIIDEAHAIGVFGKKERGLMKELQLRG